MTPSFLLACCLLLGAVLVAGCTAPQGATAKQTTVPVTTPPTATSTTAIPTISPEKVTFAIKASPTKYIPLMSSTVGIQLTPDYTPQVPVIYNWSTNYGYFVSWNATDGKVTQFNQSVQTAERSIYWTYAPEDMGKKKPPVTVRLIIETARLPHGGGEGRGTITWSEVRIGWEGNDTAVAEA